MSDLVERLRTTWVADVDDRALLLEAKSEIERLRARVERQHKALKDALGFIEYPPLDEDLQIQRKAILDLIRAALEADDA